MLERLTNNQTNLAVSKVSDARSVLISALYELDQPVGQTRLNPSDALIRGVGDVENIARRNQIHLVTRREPDDHLTRREIHQRGKSGLARLLDEEARINPLDRVAAVGRLRIAQRRDALELLTCDVVGGVLFQRLAIRALGLAILTQLAQRLAQTIQRAGIVRNEGQQLAVDRDRF